MTDSISDSFHLLSSSPQSIMGKKDKKSKTIEQRARVAARQTKKAAQKENKVKLKGTDDSDAEDVDLESVLEEYAKQVGRARLASCRHDYKPLTTSASTISQGYRDTLRASPPTLVINTDRIAIKRQGTLPFRGRVFQRSSRNIF